MADTNDIKATEAAEKAFATAVEAVATVSPAPEAAPAVEAAPAPEAAVTLPALKKARATKPAAPVKAAKPAKAAPKAAKVAVKAPKVAAPKVAAKVAKVVKTPVSKKTAAPKAARIAKPVAATSGSTISQIKDKIMAKTTTKDFTAAITDTFADIQAKAKTVYAKGTAAVGEANAFAKGNVEAVVESGKILAEGFKVLGNEAVVESKTAFETLTADAKKLAEIKSPVDFFKFQSDLLRRNLETAVAYGKKNSEATIKLATEAFAPISARASLAVEKVSKAA